MTEFTFEQKSLCELPTLDPVDLIIWLADLGDDDQWVDGGESVTRAVLVQGDHVIIWQDEPLTGLDKRDAISEYEERIAIHSFSPDQFPRWKSEHRTSRCGYPVPPDTLNAEDAREWGKRAVETLVNVELDGLREESDMYWLMDARRWAWSVLDLVTAAIGSTDPVLLAYSETAWADAEAALGRGLAYLQPSSRVRWLQEGF